MRHLLFSSFIALVLASCVGQKDFTVSTTPPGATVTINGQPLEGVTPVTTRIKQEKDLGIVVRKPGYETTSTTVKTKPHWFYGAIWTQEDPRARYIDQDEVIIPMTPVPKLSDYSPTKLPAFDGKTLPTPLPAPKTGTGKAPALRPMPEEF